MKLLTRILNVSLLLGLLFQNYAQNKIEFREITGMNSDRFGMGYTTDSKYIYAVCGGFGFTPFITNTVERYNPLNDKWEVLSDKLMRKRYCNAEYLPMNNKLYIFNGEFITETLRKYLNQVEIFDLATNELTVGERNPYPVKSAGSVVYDNKIYFFGGENLNGVSDKFFEYDPIKNTWKRLPDMLKAKQTSGKVIDGILYVLGGYDGVQQLKSIETYNFKDSTWRRIGELPTRVSAHALALNGNEIWIIGSYENTDYTASYNTVTNEVKEYDSNLIGRRHAGAQVLDNKLYVFGGNKNSRSISAMNSAEELTLPLITKQ